MKFRKALATEPCSLNQLEIVEAELGELHEGEIRVKMAYAPIRHSDLNHLSDNYGTASCYPFTPGGEGSGWVVESRHSAFSEGDLVIPLNRMEEGTWSEMWQASGDLFYKVQSISAKQAATLRINALSALLMLENYRGEGAVLVNAANSHIGFCLLTIAQEQSIPIVATVRNESSMAALQAEFPEATIRLDDREMIEEIQAFAQKTPINLALNAVGGESGFRQLNLLNKGGTQITYGGLSGSPTKTSASALIFKNLTIKGFWLQSELEKMTKTEVCQRLRTLEALDLKTPEVEWFTF